MDIHETQLLQLLRLLKELIVQIKRGQDELRNILVEQFQDYKHIADYSKRFPEIIDNIIEKNNLATEQLIKSLDERYSFIVNTDSSEYKNLK